ncbi:unnamed protein product [Closterium sp. Yama58-4]|nr:unnamed protein product [Closterium sp. Yama58-4]
MSPAFHNHSPLWSVLTAQKAELASNFVVLNRFVLGFCTESKKIMATPIWPSDEGDVTIQGIPLFDDRVWEAFGAEEPAALHDAVHVGTSAQTTPRSESDKHVDQKASRPFNETAFPHSQNPTFSMSQTESGKSEVFFPGTPNDASASRASGVTQSHDQLPLEIDECVLTGAPQCSPEDAFTLMELTDVVGGNAVSGGDHLGGPCDGDHLAGPCDMDGDMDGDLLQGDDVLGASWDACDHTGNLEAILRSSYQPAKPSQCGSATGQHSAQPSIAGILSHIHASAASAASAVPADAGKQLWEGPAAEFEAARRRGECETEERRREGDDGENAANFARFATLPSAGAVGATEGGGAERANAGGLCDSVLRSPSPLCDSIPQRLSLLQVRADDGSVDF